MNKVTVLGTACCILINFGNGPWDCCLVNMLRRTAAVPESVWCTSIWIWWQSGSLLLFGHFYSKDDFSTIRDCFNGLRDCLVNMVRRRAAVPETVMCTTQWISLLYSARVHSMFQDISVSPKGCILNVAWWGKSLYSPRACSMFHNIAGHPCSRRARIVYAV